ncbi:TonB protein C-terminal [Dyella sp. OK004]|uniref:energy transducer TonB n=1 Tax=Dyella sp. OK004 TaxID=1855292 RepID=UPI0008F12B6E|nr:energy transducer TonB [Dyella sp. OK004]SFS18792.1 TonB protein C-terminal [Dyella sp. OK004]
MKRLWIAVLFLAFCGLAYADGVYAVRKRVEASMVVTGTIVVSPDGGVQSYELDKPDQLPPEVVSLIRKAAAEWRFEPVVRDGKAVAARAKMNLRVVAKHDEGSQDYTARIAGATFGDGTSDEQVSFKDRHVAPRYPIRAIEARVSGTVYLIVRIDRDGKVADVSAEQVNLALVASDSELRRWREILADASIQAAREWTYNPPTSGPHAKDEYWIARLPVAFNLHQIGRPATNHYGQWQGYVPGPKEPVPWLSKYPLANDDKGSAADALADNNVHMLGSGLRLVTPLDHS